MAVGLLPKCAQQDEGRCRERTGRAEAREAERDPVSYGITGHDKASRFYLNNNQKVT